MVGQLNLKSMSVEKLSDLKNRVDAALSARVAEERRSLEAKLHSLSRINSPGGIRVKGMRGAPRGKVAPKYRNPANPAETWAGRGLKPRWLTAAMKSGKKLEHFAIAAKSKTTATKRMAKATRKGRRAAKR
jgi:DNA-binding protein H-NS